MGFSSILDSDLCNNGVIYRVLTVLSNCFRSLRVWETRRMVSVYWVESWQRSKNDGVSCWNESTRTILSLVAIFFELGPWHLWASSPVTPSCCNNIYNLSSRNSTATAIPCLMQRYLVWHCLCCPAILCHWTFKSMDGQGKKLQVLEICKLWNNCITTTINNYNKHQIYLPHDSCPAHIERQNDRMNICCTKRVKNKACQSRSRFCSPCFLSTIWLPGCGRDWFGRRIYVLQNNERPAGKA